MDGEGALPLWVLGEDGISSGSGASLGIRGGGFKLIAFGAKPVLEPFAGFGILTMLLNDGDVSISAEQCICLSIYLSNDLDVSKLVGMDRLARDGGMWPLERVGVSMSRDVIGRVRFIVGAERGRDPDRAGGGWWIAEWGDCPK